MAVKDILNVSLEFSHKLGIRELPHLSKNYESNIPGMYIIGDLADAPVIKIALNQGYDTVEKLYQREFSKGENTEDSEVVRLGDSRCGPGRNRSIASGEKVWAVEHLCRKRKAISYTIQNYPKNKLIFQSRKILEKIGFLSWIRSRRIWSIFGKKRSTRIIFKSDNLGKSSRRKERRKFCGNGDGRRGRTLGRRGCQPKSQRTFHARRVILAIGRRGRSINLVVLEKRNLTKCTMVSKTQTNIEERRYLLLEEDSAVEAALALAQAGADVTISYRKDAFIRAKLLNKQRIEDAITAGRLKALYSSTVTEIQNESVTLAASDGPTKIENHRVFVLISTKLPEPFLRKIGVMMEGAFTWQRLAFISFFALITYAFYCIKAYGKIAPVAEWYWPFGPGHPLAFLHEYVKLNLGWRSVDGGFWGTVVYSIMIALFSISAIKKYKSPIQTKRYLSLVFFQLFFLFAIPELIGPFIIDGGEGGTLFARCPVALVDKVRSLTLITLKAHRSHLRPGLRWVR